MVTVSVTGEAISAWISSPSVTVVVTAGYGERTARSVFHTLVFQVR